MDEHFQTQFDHISVVSGLGSINNLSPPPDGVITGYCSHSGTSRSSDPGWGVSSRVGAGLVGDSVELCVGLLGASTSSFITGVNHVDTYITCDY